MGVGAGVGGRTLDKMMRVSADPKQAVFFMDPNILILRNRGRKVLRITKHI
jgi:hypothetical protein